MQDIKIIGRNYEYLRTLVGLTRQSVIEKLRLNSDIRYFETGARKSINTEFCLTYYKYLAKQELFPTDISFQDTLNLDLQRDVMIRKTETGYIVKFVAEHPTDSQTGPDAFEAFLADPDISVTLNPSNEEIEFLSGIKPSKYLLITKQFYIGALYARRKLSAAAAKAS